MQVFGTILTLKRLQDLKALVLQFENEIAKCCHSILIFFPKIWMSRIETQHRFINYTVDVLFCRIQIHLLYTILSGTHHIVAGDD